MKNMEYSFAQTNRRLMEVGGTECRMVAHQNAWCHNPINGSLHKSLPWGHKIIHSHMLDSWQLLFCQKHTLI